MGLRFGVGHKPIGKGKRTPGQHTGVPSYMGWALRPFFVCERQRERMTKKEQELEALLTPTVRGLGCEIWGIEYRPRGRGRTTLRLFIDSATGVGIDDCERVSQQVSALLDVEDPIVDSYRLEVSSPGLDRVLFRREQYEASVGEQVQVRLAFPFEGRRHFEGQLAGVFDKDVLLRDDDIEYSLPLQQIQRTRIVPNI